MKQRERERATLDGFLDALEHGHPDPFVKPDHVQIAYNKGFGRGLRAVERLTKAVQIANGK